jgi:hypothetical protein
MKPPDVWVRDVAAPRVLAHLTSRAEMVAFMRGTMRGDVADVDEVRLLDNHDVALDEWHVTLTDDARKQVLAWAVGAAVLVEVHSHGTLGRPAVFSATDLEGLASWVPHLMWRLPGIVYVSLVFAGDTFDGLAWRAGEAPTGIGLVGLRGVGEWKSTGRSLMRWQRTDHG